MTPRPAGGPNDAPDRPQDLRPTDGGTQIDTVLEATEPQDGPSLNRVVYRATTALHPHPRYQELRGPIAATQVQRAKRQAGPLQEPLLTTVDGTILDGHARWQVAIERHQPTLPCFEYDVTDDEALQVVIQRHRRSEGLNDYGRIVLALGLESYFREQRRGTPSTGHPRPSSKLTNHEHRDVRKNIAEAAGVSTGNVTKVKQILNSVIPELRERLLGSEVSIHRAWQWRTLSPKDQRDALGRIYTRGASSRRSAGWSGRTLTPGRRLNPPTWPSPCSVDSRCTTRPTSRWRSWTCQGEPWW